MIHHASPTPSDARAHALRPAAAPRPPQIEGKDRHAVEAAGQFLGLEGSFIPRSYIEQARGRRETAAAGPLHASPPAPLHARRVRCAD